MGTDEKTPGNASPCTVLVVDDDPTIATLIESALQELEDMEVSLHTAGDAMSARNCLEETQFGMNLVFLDLGLPGTSGEELLDWICAVEPSLPVIIVSGTRDDTVLMRCLSKGAGDYLPKPFLPKDVQAIAKRVLKRKENAKSATGVISAEVPTTGWIELTAPSEMEHLKRMQRFTDLLFETSLPEDVRDDMRMIVEEAGRNAIEWGNRFDSNKQFKISYCIFEDRIVLKFEDEGEGFDVSVLRNPTLDPRDHIKKRMAEGKRPGGFGVFLLQKLMDEVVYSDKGNIVVMTKLFPPPAE